MSTYPKNRLFSLDLLRGLDMFLLTVVGPFFYALNSLVHLPPGLLRQFDHAWGEFHLWDIIMPLFIFMCGAAVPLALGRRLKDGRPTWGYWRHVLLRVAGLWLLGMVAQGRLLTLNPALISPFNNTLQSIASGYLIASLVLLIPSRKIRWLMPVALAGIYTLLLHFLGDYSRTGNFAQLVENAVVPLLTPQGSRALELADPGYTWWLTTLMFGAMTLCGMEATEILLAEVEKKVRLARLAALGIGLLILGWALVPWIPSIKHIYTLTFTAQAMGWNCLALAALYYLTDMRSWRRGLGLFILFGQTALLAYLSIEVFGCVFAAFGKFTMQGIPFLFGKAALPLASWLAQSALLVAVLCSWKRAHQVGEQRTGNVVPH